MSPERVTFGSVADAWLKSKRVEETTRARYESALDVWLRPRFDGRLVGSITEDDLAQLVRDMEEAGRKPWTIRATLVAASGVFGFAVRRGYLARNPVAYLTRDERPTTPDRRHAKAFTRDQLETVLAAVPDSHRLLFEAMAATGVRFGEALALEWRHVNMTARVVRVEQQATQAGVVKPYPKTQAGRRELPLPDALVRKLRRHKIATRWSEPHHPVFATSTGTAQLQANIRERVLRPTLRKLDLWGKGYTTHSFRRSYVSALIASGLDVVEVCRLAGHSSPSVTLDSYAREFEARSTQDDRVRDVVDALLK